MVMQPSPKSKSYLFGVEQIFIKACPSSKSMKIISLHPKVNITPFIADKLRVAVDRVS